MGQEGVDARAMGIFYREVVQVVLLFGLDTWVMWSQDSGQVSPPGEPMNNGAAAKTADRWELVVPTPGDGDDWSGLGGGGELICLPP